MTFLQETSRSRVFCFALSLALGSAASSAFGQTPFFGKNKIQYKHFDWHVLESRSIRLYYYSQEERLATKAIQLAEDANDRIAARFGFELPHKIPLIIYSSHVHFQQTNVTRSFLPEGVAGFTEFVRGRVAMPFNGSLTDFKETLEHEITHVYQMSFLNETYRLHYRNQMPRPPLWLTEGQADYWAEPWNATADWVLRDLVIHDTLPSIQDLWQLNGTFALYKAGQDLVRWLEDNYGPDVVPRTFRSLWQFKRFDQALESVTGSTLSRLTVRWHHDLHRRYFPDVQTHEPLDLAAEPLETEGGNFKPATVPPGAPLPKDVYYFFSTRTGYTNVYRSSLETGSSEALIQGQRSDEFESFHAFQSQMEVSSKGDLALVSKFQDRDALYIYDLGEERILGQWQFEGLLSIRSPSFSPDGNRVVFAALHEAARQDLYVLDLQTEDLIQLTDDDPLDDYPAWSPSGRMIVFASDRASPKGEMDLFGVDPSGANLVQITFSSGDATMPAWSPDGELLAFVGDGTGSPQLYVGSWNAPGLKDIFQVTHILGGATDPAWLSGGRGLLFAGMSNQEFGVYRLRPRYGEVLPDSAFLAPPGVTATPLKESAGYPGPLPTTAFVPVTDDTLATRRLPYDARFSLDFAQGGIAVEPGVRSGEGLQGLLSDQLGNQVLLLQLGLTSNDFSSIWDHLSAGVTYYDLSHRIDRGASVFRFSGEFVDEIGELFFEKRTGGSVLLSYPFSTYNRLETSLGLLHSDRSPDSFRKAREAYLVSNHLAYVHDTSLWLSTGPIDGSRYKIGGSVSTNLESGEIDNLAGYVDWRRYFRTGRETAYALRGFFGVAGGAFPQRFVQGGSWSLRLYDWRQFAGTRSLLINQEWRFPILQNIGLGTSAGTIGLPGVQGALFLDMGQTWDGKLDVGDTKGSLGVGFRMSFGGLLILRLDVGRRTNFEKLFNKTYADFFVGFNY